MAADPALPLTRMTEAMRQLFATLSQPDVLPELEKLQACALCINCIDLLNELEQTTEASQSSSVNVMSHSSMTG